MTVVGEQDTRKQLYTLSNIHSGVFIVLHLLVLAVHTTRTQTTTINSLMDPSDMINAFRWTVSCPSSFAAINTYSVLDKVSDILLIIIPLSCTDMKLIVCTQQCVI